MPIWFEDKKGQRNLRDCMRGRSITVLCEAIFTLVRRNQESEWGSHALDEFFFFRYFPMLYGWLVITWFDESFKTLYFDEYVKSDIKLNLDSLPHFPSKMSTKNLLSWERKYNNSCYFLKKEIYGQMVCLIVQLNWKGILTETLYFHACINFATKFFSFRSP